MGAWPAAFLTDDSVELWGELRGDGPRWVLLVHDRGRDVDSFAGLAERIAGDGFTVLAFDSRGCGLSAGEEDETSRHLDVVAAAHFARERGARELFAVGAGAGSDVLVQAAAAARLDAMVLVSPFLPKRRRRELTAALRSHTKPRLVLVGSQHEQAMAAARVVLDLAIGPRVLVQLPSAEQSHALINGACAAQAVNHLMTFLCHNRRRLEPVPSAAP